jgi:hypothetical protein
MTPRKHRTEIRQSLMRAANSSRDTADELARAWGGCDDPQHPWMPVGEGQQLFGDWRDFTEQVCRPLVEADGDDDKAEQAAMALYRKASPYYICVSLVMALNRINDLEHDRNHPYGEVKP